MGSEDPPGVLIFPFDFAILLWLPKLIGTVSVWQQAAHLQFSLLGSWMRGHSDSFLDGLFMLWPPVLLMTHSAGR